MARNISAIILYDKNKKILLQHRAEDAERLPGYWAFFGGGIEKGETPEQAVRREALEELNYPLNNPKLIMKQFFFYKNEKNEKNIFMEEYNPSRELILGEGQDMKWWHLSKLGRLKIVDHDAKVLEYIKDKY